MTRVIRRDQTTTINHPVIPHFTLLCEKWPKFSFPKKKEKEKQKKRVNELYKIIFTKIDALCNESYNCGEDSGGGRKWRGEGLWVGCEKQVIKIQPKTPKRDRRHDDNHLMMVRVMFAFFSTPPPPPIPLPITRFSSN